MKYYCPKHGLIDAKYVTNNDANTATCRKCGSGRKVTPTESADAPFSCRYDAGDNMLPEEPPSEAPEHANVDNPEPDRIYYIDPDTKRATSRRKER